MSDDSRVLLKDMVRSSSYVATLWPLLFILRAAGCLPLRVRKSGKLQCGAGHVSYSVCMLVTQLAITVNFVHHKLQVAYACDSEIIRIVSYVNIFFLSTPMILAPMIAVQAPAQLKLFEHCSKFQIQYEYLSESKLDPRLQKTVWIFIVGVIFHTFFVLFFRPIVLQDFIHTVDLLHIFGMGYELILLARWYITCKITCHTSKCLIHQLQIIENNADFNKKSRKLCQLWLQLFHLIEQLGSSMYISQGVLLVFEFVNLLLSTYYFIIFKEFEVRVMFAIVLTLCSLSLLVHCLSGHAVNTQVQNDIFQALEVIKKLSLDVSEKQKLLHYFTHLSNILPKVDLQGYMEVGRGLLATLTSAFVSSLIILIQLNAMSYEFSSTDVKNSTCMSFL